MAIICTINLGADYQWTWGDGVLESARMTLAEGESGNSCEFSISDPDLTITDSFFEYIESIDGLEPLVIDKKSLGSTGVPSSLANMSLTAEQAAWADVVAWAEGADYNVRFGGMTFDGFEDHPRLQFSSNGFSSDAAGRYQALSSTWDEVVAQDGLPDFSPKSQDLFFVARLGFRDAVDDVALGNINSILDKISWEWASLPDSNGNYRYSGQGTKTVLQVTEYYEERAEYYRSLPQQSAEAATVATAPANKPQSSSRRQDALPGQQIIMLWSEGDRPIVASAFLHIGLELTTSPNRLTFRGQAGSWVLTQQRRTTAYTNLSLRQIASIICGSYGLTLEMEEEGPTYEYFPQLGRTDYEALLLEARRVGFRVTTRGATLRIGGYVGESATVLQIGANLGPRLTISHEASGTSSGGARSSDPSEKTETGVRKWALDPDTGSMVQETPEATNGAGSGATQGTTGEMVAPLTPIVKSDAAADRIRKKNSVRVHGIKAEWEAPTDAALLLIDPDTAVATSGLSEQLDRVWVVESISHALGNNGAVSSGVLYSPLTNKYPSPDDDTPGSGSSGAPATPGQLPPMNPGGFIKPSNGVLTSAWRTSDRPRHQGVDLAGAANDPIWASADGVVVDVENSCPGLTPQPSCGSGYGNLVFIDHAGGYQTRYTHLNTVAVAIGETVTQGQVIGTEGDSGSSRGVHLHFEVRLNGTDENPAQHINI